MMLSAAAAGWLPQLAITMFLQRASSAPVLRHFHFLRHCRQISAPFQAVFIFEAAATADAFRPMFLSLFSFEHSFAEPTLPITPDMISYHIFAEDAFAASHFAAQHFTRPFRQPPLFMMAAATYAIGFRRRWLPLRHADYRRQPLSPFSARFLRRFHFHAAMLSHG
jgi:hypothetical protein